MSKLQVFAAIFALLHLSSSSLITKRDEAFIVGGFPAQIADYPHSLALLDMVRGGFICGASNIHRLWALTAAHCELRQL